MKLIKIQEVAGKIILRSGLHIGAGDVEMRIGGTDNPVVKHPHTNEPYIPGSSLKGKVRALLEMRSGLMPRTEGRPISLKDLQNVEGDQRVQAEKILKLFGTSGADADGDGSLGPSRASFGDCPLDEDWKNRALELHWPLTEIKSENSINRIRGTAENPRFTERVPAGAEFRFSITLKQLQDDEDDLLDFLLEGLKLLEMDALGGSGSRGYGRIQLEFQDEEINKRFSQIQPFSKEENP